MSTKVASLYAEIGAQTKGFEQGAAKVKGGLNSLAGQFRSVIPPAVAQFATLGGAVLGVAGAIKTVMDFTTRYDETVRDLAYITGVGAEESSRLLQVLDDFKLTASDVMTATRAMTREGLSPTLETLSKLSDEYNRLNPGQERAAFLMKNFGRTGLQFAEAMSKGGDALRQMGEEVEKGLIRTDAQIGLTRLWELRLDNLNDKIDATKVSIGSTFIGAIDGSSQAIEILTDQIFRAKTGMSQFEYVNQNGRAGLRDLVDASREAATEQYLLANGIDLAAEAAENSIPQLIGLADTTGQLYSEALLETIFSTKDATDRYDETIIKLNEDLKNGAISAEEHGQGMVAAAGLLQQAQNKIIFGLVQMQLAADGWQASDTEAILSVGQQLGMFSQAEANMASQMIANAQAIADAHTEMGDQMKNATPEQLATLGELEQELLKGQITAEQYAQKVKAIYTAIQRLNGQEATAYVNIITTGSVPTFGGNFGATRMETGPGFSGQGGAGRRRRQAGGSFIVPPQFGIEGLPLGDGTASAGERVTVTPKGATQTSRAAGSMNMSEMRMMAKMFAAELAKVVA